MSELSFGSWVTYGNQVDTKAAVECMAAAWDAGVNFFDNAEVYAAGESERIMGEAFEAIWQLAQERKLPLRTAAFVIGHSRVLEARAIRGLYP